jgi:hypothetical protein
VLKKILKASEQSRPDVALSRERWKSEQSSMDINRLVFIDESAAKTNMARLRGRSKHGSRCHCSVPYGHWSTMTMISSLRYDGDTTCLAIEGGTTSEVFREYVRQILSPTLRPGDIGLIHK